MEKQGSSIGIFTAAVVGYLYGLNRHGEYTISKLLAYQQPVKMAQDLLSINWATGNTHTANSGVGLTPDRCKIAKGWTFYEKRRM